MRVGAHEQHPGVHVAAFERDDVADPLGFVVLLDAPCVREVARDARDLDLGLVVRGHEVVRRDDDLRRIPDARPESLEHRLQPARAR